MSGSSVRFTINVRTILCVMALTVSGCAGCEDDTATPAPSAVPPSEANGELEQYRCRISNTAWSSAEDTPTSPWLTRGASGPMLYGRRTINRTLAWSDGRRVGSVDDAERLRPDLMAWTGHRLLALSADRLESYNDAVEDRRPLRAALPYGATDASLVELPGRAAVVGTRVARGQSAGSAFVQFLGADGEPTGALHTLSSETGAVVSAVRARWDFGRLVVTATVPDLSYVYWVLDADGAVLNSGTNGATVACPRGGCLRVFDAQQGTTDNEIHVENTGFLRVESLDGNTRYDTNAEATSLRAVAVSGDRVMVMMTPANEALGCTVRVIDVSRRQVVADGPDFHDDGLTCELSRVRPIAKGFAIAVSDATHGVGVRTIECGR